MKRKNERRPNWAAAPPCSRRDSSSSLGVKKIRSSTSQELHRLDQPEDLHLDITGELAGGAWRGAQDTGHPTQGSQPSHLPWQGRRLQPHSHKSPSQPHPLLELGAGIAPLYPELLFAFVASCNLTRWVPSYPTKVGRGSPF